MSKKEMINLLHLILLSGAKHYKLPPSVTYREDDSLVQEIRGQAKIQAEGEHQQQCSRVHRDHFNCDPPSWVFWMSYCLVGQGDHPGAGHQPPDTKLSKVGNVSHQPQYQYNQQ